MRGIGRGGWRWQRGLQCVAVVAALAAMATPGDTAQASPLSAGATVAVAWPSTTLVRYDDLNADDRVVDPQFSWDPIPRAAKYEVEVNSSDQWAVGSRVCCDDKSIGTSLSPVKLLPNNTYYWRIRAIDTAGQAGDWNQWCGNDVPPCAVPMGFDKTFDNVQPTIPALRVRDSVADARPPVGASGFPTTDVPVIAWDPVPGASSYELGIAPWVTSSGGFCNWSAAHRFTTATTAWTPLASTASNPLGNGTPSVSAEPWFLQNGTSYCVRARARSDRDALGGDIVSDWTQVGGLGHAAFTYQPPSLPPCGPAATPAAAYHDEPSRGEATLRVPLFTWDRVTGACGYYVVIAKDPEFTKIADIAFTTVPAYAPRKPGGPTTYTDETTSYYWAVMPSVSSAGDGVSTQPQENHPQPFNKRTVPPTLLAPKGEVSGVPSFRWTAAEGAREYRIQVDDEATFGTPITDAVTSSTAYTSTNKYPPKVPLFWRVRANDENKVGLSWSDAGTFTVLPPETSIRSGPSLNGSFASFTFTSNVPDASFKCKLDGPGAKVGAPAACTSPAAYGPLGDGDYTFTVAATDLAGNGDPTPATRAFSVDTTAPDTAISAAPPAMTSSPVASFTIASTQGGSAFECRLDGPGGMTGAWTPCTSPSTYGGLADGAYTFSARASDTAGNTDATPATSRFKVDTQAPDTVINVGPDATTAAASVLFAYTASEAGSNFECRIDGPGTSAGQWDGCGPSRSYSGLASGRYGFSVRAIDSAGNVDATPATRVFSLAVPAAPEVPVVSPIAGPAAGAPEPGGLGQPAPPPVAKQLGEPRFRAPRRPIAVRRGTARLRFDCLAPDGCVTATFELRWRTGKQSPALRRTFRVKAAAAGTRTVAVTFNRAARRALVRAGRRGLNVTMTPVRTGKATRFKLVARR